jgi:hypothetical protein
MRRPVAVIDQLPGSLFVTGAVLVLSLIKAARTLARLERKQGALELTGILVGACFVGLMIFAIRRRQTGVWVAAAQVLGVALAADLLSLVLVWPFVPPGLTLSLADVVGAGLANGALGAFLGVPLWAGGLWVSRRYGSHSGVTERRLREILKRRRSREGESLEGERRVG